MPNESSNTAEQLPVPPTPDQSTRERDVRREERKNAAHGLTLIVQGLKTAEEIQTKRVLDDLRARMGLVTEQQLLASRKKMVIPASMVREGQEQIRQELARRERAAADPTVEVREELVPIASAEQTPQLSTEDIRARRRASMEGLEPVELGPLETPIPPMDEETEAGFARIQRPLTAEAAPPQVQSRRMRLADAFGRAKISTPPKRNIDGPDPYADTMNRSA